MVYAVPSNVSSWNLTYIAKLVIEIFYHFNFAVILPSKILKTKFIFRKHIQVFVSYSTGLFLRSNFTVSAKKNNINTDKLFCITLVLLFWVQVKFCF